MRSFVLALSLSLASAAPAFAVDVEERVQPTLLSFNGGQRYTNAVLTVSGPNDFLKEETAPRGLPVFRLQTAGRLVDGLYSYSLSAATDEVMPQKNVLDNGRGPDVRQTAYKPFAMYGYFRVEEGRMIPVDENAAGADGDG